MKNKLGWITCLLLMTIAPLPALAPAASAQQKIPDAILKVTLQQREKGKLNPDLHFQELRCWRGACSLTTVTVGSCRPSPVSTGKASPLIIERASTDEGTLKVSREGNTFVVIETGSDIGGRYVTTHCCPN
jgi:hypothetical protein